MASARAFDLIGSYPTERLDLTDDAMCAALERFHRVALATPRPSEQCRKFAALEQGVPQADLQRHVERVYGHYYSESVWARSAPLGGWRKRAQQDASRSTRLRAALAEISRHIPDADGALRKGSPGDCAAELAALEDRLGVVLPLDAREALLHAGYHNIRMMRAAPSGPSGDRLARRTFPFATALFVREDTDRATGQHLIAAALDPDAVDEGITADGVAASLLDYYDDAGDEDAHGVLGLHRWHDSERFLVLTGRHRGEVWQSTPVGSTFPVSFRASDLCEAGEAERVADLLCLAERSLCTFLLLPAYRARGEALAKRLRPDVVTYCFPTDAGLVRP